ncbi:MAG: flagellar hook-length control protein FliK [Ruminiclostridium sp.]
MMNAAAVLPVSAATAFTGNAARISDNSTQQGFSDALGAMVTGNQTSSMNAAQRRAPSAEEGLTAEELLLEVAELDFSNEELKTLLKTAELAGYMQGSMYGQAATEFTAVDSEELMQILGNAVSAEGVDAVSAYSDSTVALPEQIPQDNAEEKTENDVLVQSFMPQPEETEKSIDAVPVSDTKADITPSADDITKQTTAEVNTYTNAPETKSASYQSVSSENEATVAEPQDKQSVMRFAQVTSYEKQAEDSTQTATDNADISDSTQRFAFTKRNVEIKSDELRQISKNIDSVKQTGDTEPQRKVTASNTASDSSAGIFTRSESRFEDLPQTHSEVKVPISDMAGFISDHAPKLSGKTSLTVVLTPETLGKITVRMVNESGKLTVEILTETAEAKQLLQAKSEQLAYALRNDNVELTSYKVETSQTELFQRDFDGSSKNPYRQQSQKDNNNESDEFDSLLGEIQAMD